MSKQEETMDDLVQRVENMATDSVAMTPGEELSSDLVNTSTEGEETADKQLELHSIKDDKTPSPSADLSNEPITPDQYVSSLESESDTPSTPQQIYADPSDADDGEGEWITPQNAGIHKSHALDLLPDNKTKGKGKRQGMKEIGAGCMTADFAMQNVLLQMGLDLISVDGKRIQRVRNYVLRCHACFK